MDCFAQQTRCMMARMSTPTKVGHFLDTDIVADLDPGIRDVVVWLDAHGFRTTDSGDGVTKPAAGWDPEFCEDEPHVHMALNKGGSIERAADLLALQLREAGIAVVEFGHEGGAWIQASYDPVKRTAMLHLYHLNDDGLRAAMAKHVGG